MWSALRGRRLDGLKFVRQYPIGPYFADFVCRERMVIIEIDGATHSTEEERTSDARRTEYLRAQGFRIFRACNGDVYENLEGVLEGLMTFIADRSR
jgi:very-short-patch-repair endonuclease